MRTRKLIVFVAIFISGIFILGLFWLPGTREQARVNVTLLNLQAVAAASRSYFTNCGVWPRTISELTTTNNPKQAVFLVVTRPPLADAWGQPLAYLPYDASNRAGAVQSRKRGGDGRQVVYEVKFGR